MALPRHPRRMKRMKRKEPNGCGVSQISAPVAGVPPASGCVPLRGMARKRLRGSVIYRFISHLAREIDIKMPSANPSVSMAVPP
jgi:ABC-type cobalamin transport system ATPase subunit